MATRWLSKRAVRIPVDVRAGACGDEVVGWIDGVLKLKVTELEDGGRASAAVESLLAEIIGAKRSHVRVVRGFACRQKIVEIEEFDDDDLEQHLPGRAAPPPDRPSGTTRLRVS